MKNFYQIYNNWYNKLKNKIQKSKIMKKLNKKMNLITNKMIFYKRNYIKKFYHKMNKIKK